MRSLTKMSSSVDITAVQQSAMLDEVVVMGDYANAYGTWRIDPAAVADATAEVTAGKWMVRYRRNGERSWQIWRWMWNLASGPLVPAA